MLAPRPLFSLWRDGTEEVCVFGEIVACRGDSVYRSSEPGSQVVARSVLKPFQFLATGLADREQELEQRHVAALGSISASMAQLAELRRWYDPVRLQRDAARLVLPPALPMCEESRIEARRSGPSPLYHPCFSKHIAILEACDAQGWPSAGYARRDHPYHARLVALLDSMLGRQGRGIEFVVDGCALPSPVLEPLELAQLYRELASAGERTPLGHVRRAMSRDPSWIGGPDRTDTRLMARNPGLIAKEGADGLLALGVPAGDGGAAGLLVKLASGHQPAWAELAARPFLEAWGLSGLDELPAGQRVVWHVGPERLPAAPLDISPLLSERIAVWPGDSGFRRTPVTDPGAPPAEGAPSWQLLVSSIHTTLHVGAHADAPNHFVPGAAGIDRVPLEPYRGRCAVLDVHVSRGGVITPRELPTSGPWAPRLLFKTGSFPNPEHFEPEFVAFSPELIRELRARGVVLIGIDTPSVDPFSSKTLPSHHATRENGGLAILEGLELSQVPAGEYELVALPLRIEGADASPVRATLWPLR